MVAQLRMTFSVLAALLVGLLLLPAVSIASVVLGSEEAECSVIVVESGGVYEVESVQKIDAASSAVCSGFLAGSGAAVGDEVILATEAAADVVGFTKFEMPFEIYSSMGESGSVSGITYYTGSATDLSSTVSTTEAEAETEAEVEAVMTTESEEMDEEGTESTEEVEDEVEADAGQVQSLQLRVIELLKQIISLLQLKMSM